MKKNMRYYSNILSINFDFFYCTIFEIIFKKIKINFKI